MTIVKYIYIYIHIEEKVRSAQNTCVLAVYVTEFTHRICEISKRAHPVCILSL